MDPNQQPGQQQPYYQQPAPLTTPLGQSGGSLPQGYDFILNPKAPKPRLSFGRGNSTKQRIAIVAGGAIGLIIVVMIGISLLSGGGSSAAASMSDLVQEQQEIIRVATIGGTTAKTQSVQAFALTAGYSTQSSQQQVQAYLKKNAKAVTAKQINLKKNSKTDAALSAAADANQFDTTFTTTFRTSLTAYQANVKKAYDKTSNQTAKQILAEAFDGVSTLLSTN